MLFGFPAPCSPDLSPLDWRADGRRPLFPPGCGWPAIPTGDHSVVPGPKWRRPNEISRASMRGSAAAAAGRSALARPGPFGGLLTDRAPAGSPVIGLLVGCRARPWREHVIIRVQVSLGAVILTDGHGGVGAGAVHWRRLGGGPPRRRARGRRRSRLARVRLPEGLEGITRLHALVAEHRRPPGQSFRRSRWPGRWWWGSRPIAARG